MADVAKDLIEKLLKQFDKANNINEQKPEKKPHMKKVSVDDWSSMKEIHPRTAADDKKTMKQIVTIRKSIYEAYSTYVQEHPDLRFYITTKCGDTYYMFIVYKKITDMKFFGGVVYWTVYPSYFENIAWLWKKGTLLETCNYGGDLRQFDKQPRAGEILEMLDEEARQVLSLKDYKIYLDLKEREKNLK